MKFCVTYCLDVYIEADNADEAYVQVDDSLRGAGLVENLFENGVDACLTHVSIDIEPQR